MYRFTCYFLNHFLKFHVYIKKKKLKRTQKRNILLSALFISRKIWEEIFYCISINKLLQEYYLGLLLCVMIQCKLIILGIFGKFLIICYYQLLWFGCQVLRNPPGFLLLTTNANLGNLALHASANLTCSH